MGEVEKTEDNRIGGKYYKDAAHTPKHGLSIYVETHERKVLFDLGPDDNYLHNAHELRIDLTEIDTVLNGDRFATATSEQAFCHNVFKSVDGETRHE